jgi:hypothetical protein
MARTAGRPEVAIGLIDGPVAIGRPDLESESIRELPAVNGGSCALSSSAACKHGTFVAGILVAKRDSAVPAIIRRSTTAIFRHRLKLTNKPFEMRKSRSNLVVLVISRRQSFHPTVPYRSLPTLHMQGLRNLFCRMSSRTGLPTGLLKCGLARIH